MSTWLEFTSNSPSIRVTPVDGGVASACDISGVEEAHEGVLWHLSTTSDTLDLCEAHRRTLLPSAISRGATFTPAQNL